MFREIPLNGFYLEYYKSDLFLEPLRAQHDYCSRLIHGIPKRQVRYYRKHVYSVSFYNTCGAL